MEGREGQRDRGRQEGRKEGRKEGMKEGKEDVCMQWRVTVKRSTRLLACWACCYEMCKKKAGRVRVGRGHN